MWKYMDSLFTDEMIGDNVGFVYLITDNSGKKYIGKKLFTKSKTYQKNLKKKRKRVPSDWQEYTGSNLELNENISTGTTIEKEILHLCKSKGWMTYLETKEIIMKNAIIDDNYYNSWFSAKIHRKHLVKEQIMKEIEAAATVAGVLMLVGTVLITTAYLVLPM